MALFQTSDGDEARQDGCRRAALGRREEEKRQRLDRDNIYISLDPKA